MKISNNFSHVELHELVESLAMGLESRDAYTSGHSQRVAHLSEKIATKLGLSCDEIFIIHIAGHLHDIGKLGIKDKVLNKQGHLTKKEYKHIKEHSIIGYQILNKVSPLKKVAEIVRHHHEDYDGQGYPDGLQEKSIPLGSRIITVADAFDAMTTPRPYRKQIPISEAIKEIIANAGTQFDPEIANVLQKLYKNNSNFTLTI